MATSKNEMRFHIRSVGNISKVTRALEAVSVSKARQATQLLHATRPYADRAWRVVLHLVGQPEGSDLHPLLAPRPSPKSALVIVITSDRGLAGGYNMNVVRAALNKFKDYPHPVSYIAVGSRGGDMLAHRGKDMLAEYSGLDIGQDLKQIIGIGNLALESYLTRSCDEVFLCFTEYVDRALQRVMVRKLLPLEEGRHGQARVPGNQATSARSIFLYEPDKRQVIDVILPRYIALQVYVAVLSAEASEHTIRMVSMHSATKNAKELMGSLQMRYHKTRQKDITNEILDISGAAEALQEHAANED
jgi:F-type H+-transporting ATPase subunit gamma